MRSRGYTRRLAFSVALLAAALCLCCASAALATTYYVDSAGGNDNWDGTSPSTAWQSLGKVNATTFSPGDQILLKAGSVWQGADGLLYPKGSGTAGNPIVIDTYGTGAKPLINADKTYNLVMGEENVSTSIFLYNQEYWEISNLDVMNGQPGGEQQNDTHGVYITAEETGQVHDHIHLKNLDIHDVNARVGRGTGKDKGKNNGGICFDVFGALVAGTQFNDCLVEGCYIYDCGATGIKTWSDQHNWKCHDPTTYGTNFTIRNNVLDHIDGDGICTAMTEDALIEYNVVSWSHMKPSDPYVAIWNYESYDTVMQYNEAYNTQTMSDGQGFDIDDYTLRTIVQYNYSHDNVGGFMLIICIPQERSQCATADHNIVRYNVSQDDGEEIIKFAGEPHHTDFYNNVFYYSPTGGASPLEDVLRLSLSYNTHVYNNIFETWGGGNFLQPDKGVNRGFAFHKNIVYGDADYTKWTDDYPDNQWGVNPQLVNPGSGGIGRDTCGGYMLQAGSPAVDYGIWSDDPILMPLDDHPGPIGANHGSQDYFGNSLPYPSGAPDTGAHESTGGPPDPPVAEFSGNPTTGEVPLTVMFTDLSTNNPTSWDWTFGDGGSSTAQNPSHDYTSAGDYTVSLWAENAGGSDIEAKNNYVHVDPPGPQPPVADFEGSPTSGPAPLDVSFTDLSTNSPTSWDWTFGDGGTDTVQNPSHTYAAGTYTVSLTATNAYGQDTETKTDYISATSGGGGDYFPSSYEILKGTYVSGGVGDLGASDDSYLVIQAEKLGGKKCTYMVYTIDTDLTSLSSLTISLESHPTVAPQRQRIRVWDYTTGNWGRDVSDDLLNSTSDQTTVTPVPDPTDYISPAGEVKIRVRTGDKTSSAWDHHIDLVKITAAP